MRFMLHLCLIFWWVMTVYGAIKFQTNYAKDNDLIKDDPVVIEATDLLGPRGTRLLYTISFFLSILIDNILLVIALALSKYANNPDVFYHYLITLLMLNIVFDLVSLPATIKYIREHSFYVKSRIAIGLMDLIIIIFGAITIFVGW